ALLPIRLHEACAITDQAASLRKLTPFVDCRDRVARCQSHDQATSAVEKWVGEYKQCPGPSLYDIHEGCFDLSIAPSTKDHHFLADCPRRRFGFSDIRHSRGKIRV